MLKYYKNYLNNIAQTPEEKIREDVQASLISQWDNTTLLTDVKEETYIGSNIYESIEARKSTITEYSVNILKDSNDSRRLTFKDCNHKVNRGLKYYFDDNYWLTYLDTDTESVYSQVSVRRCNNVLKWLDKDSGKILTEPCSIGEEISGISPTVDKNIIIKDSHLVLVVQNNEQTKNIKENQRFIISGIPYKVVAYKNYSQSDYISQDSNLLWFNVFVDMIQSDDDIENGIANKDSYVYNIDIIQDSFSQQINKKGILKANLYLNGNIIDNEDILWKGNENGVIDSDGNYTLGNTIGNEFIVKAYLKNNIDIYDEIKITLLDEISTTKEIIISPFITEAKQYKSNFISANVYIGNELQTDVVECFVSGINSKDYTLTNDGNDFIFVSNILNSTVTLTFKSGSVEKEIIVKLKARF